MKDGLLDWDCAEAVSVPDMAAALEHIRSEGTFPVGLLTNPQLSHRADHGCVRSPSLTSSSRQPSVDSKEDQNSVGQCPASDAKIQAIKARVDAWLRPGQPGHRIFADGRLSLCLFDGFLLYCTEMRPVMDLIDVKLFLLVSRAKATQRREARDGYVTLEGFWKDPPGYVDKIVWPNYADAHAWLFRDGDVEGILDDAVLEGTGIRAQTGKGLDVDFEETFEWVVETVISELEKQCLDDK